MFAALLEGLTGVETKPGSRVFEILFLATTPLALWLVCGFLFEGLIEATLPMASGLPSGVFHLTLLAGLYGAVWWSVRAIQRINPSFLATPVGYSQGEAILPILGWALAAYVVGGVLIGGVAYMLVSQTDEHLLLIVYGLTVWVPAWFAMPIAAYVAWSRVRR